MSKYFPDVWTEEGAAAGSKNGYWSALAFAAMIVLGLAFLVFSGNIPGLTPGEASDMPFEIAGVLIELALALAAAWRFKIHKGLIIGPIITSIFVLEIISKVSSGTTNFGWIFFYAAVSVGLINGIRAAYSHREMAKEVTQQSTN